MRLLDVEWNENFVGNIFGSIVLHLSGSDGDDFELLNDSVGSASGDSFDNSSGLSGSDKPSIGSIVPDESDEPSTNNIETVEPEESNTGNNQTLMTLILANSVKIVPKTTNTCKNYKNHQGNHKGTRDIITPDG